VEKDYYCSQKFWWLSVNLEKSETLSCCAATPTKINLDHLLQNPGELFNSPALVGERQDMLDNKPVPSCSATCWQAEDQHLTSRRLLMHSNHRTHTNIKATPETLHIITGTDCNMSCVYCCKAYSSAWARDLDTNGPYTVDTKDQRFKLDSLDRIVMKLSQKQVAHSSFNQRLVNEIETIFNNHDLREVVITGGEPFLYLGLEELVSKLTNKGTVIRIWSGLGVDPARFAREIKKLSKFSNVEIVISAETTGKLYELVRYGNTWDRLLQNINTLEQLSVDHSFYCTVTNLTLLGVEEFASYVGNKKTVYSLCTDPSFLAVNVLDPANKQKLLDQLETLPEQLRSILIKDLALEPTSQQQTDLKTYLTEFSNRRNIDLNFLPETFKQWAL